MKITGTFDITRTTEPPYDTAPGATLARTRFDKTFHGGLVGTSVVHMLSAVTEVEGSAAYVALERVVGSIDGREGSFVLQHSGTMTRGAPSLSVTIVPGSGTGALVGISGRMTIEIVGGRHHYTLEHELPPA